METNQKRGINIMSVIGIIAKLFVNILYGFFQLFGILSEGVSKLSIKMAELLMNLDKKLTEEFEDDETETVPV